VVVVVLVVESLGIVLDALGGAAASGDDPVCAHAAPAYPASVRLAAARIVRFNIAVLLH
jgi:hypothetical protein